MLSASVVAGVSTVVKGLVAREKGPRMSRAHEPVRAVEIIETVDGDKLYSATSLGC
jgi:hypothetical protein